MAVVKVYDQSNKEVGEISLASEVFEVPVKAGILNFVVRAQRAAQRAGTHATKTRAFVSGGGAKPFKQKGTGRARAGSNRSPIWRGGAVIFGPSPRSYEFKVNKKVRSLALKMALSSRLNNGLMVVKSLDMPEIKTKAFAQVAKSLSLGKALIVAHDDNVNLALSARNIPGITLTTVDRLNVYDILNHPQLVFLENAVATVHERLK